MWKLYRRRHLWLLQLYSLFAALYGSFNEEGSVPAQPLHGRRLLNVVNHSTPSSEDGVVDSVVPSCIPPSLDEFPDDFFTQEQREKGGLIVHFLIVAYMCSMLAIVCDKYFVPCLKVMSSYFKVPSDIAGATFMAVGTSSPELFSSVIGAFVTEGDIGVGTVVGSAVFNILAVTGAAGIAVGAAAVHLDWYPITRDCSMYLITISTLVFIIHDNLVTWVEALVLICMFIGYLLLLYFNCHVQKVTTKTAKNVHKWWKRKKGLNLDEISKSILDETAPLVMANRSTPRYQSNEDSACPSSGSTSLMASSELTSSEGSDTLAKESGQFKHPPILVPQMITGGEKYIIITGLEDATKTLKHKKLSSDSEDMEESVEIKLWEIPAGCLQKLTFVIMWIPNFIFYLTIPRCDLPGRTKFFPLTFITSILWLGVMSYMCFWMVAVIGYTLGIPDTVSGITILAAGTSVPEIVSSVIVVKNGLGNMALCNLLGSNIFDILFCLGVPWLIKSLMNNETKSLVINSSALTYTTMMLLCVVILFYLALVICKWKLNWRYGIVAFLLYVCFLVIASMYESNVFGEFNPPVCTS